MKIFKVIPAIFLVVYYFFASIVAGNEAVDENIQYQKDRMSYLKNEFYVNYTPCDESKIASFDIEEAIKRGVKFNELQFLGTHNSYQLAPTEEYKKLYNSLSDLTLGLVSKDKAEFCMDSLTEQFELGIRSVELDIETVDKNGNVGFIVSHNPIYDNTSSCYDFELALEEIKLWSDNNPGHLPITVIIEPKKNVPAVRDLKNFSIKYANIFDELIREKMGDTLLTPKDMMGEYESLKEMREDDGWLTIDKALGKVIFLLHDTTVTSDYIKQDESVKSQAMFPMLRYSDRNKSYASFIIDNKPDEAVSHEAEAIDKCNLIVRTRADSFPNFSEKRYENTNNCSSQIISTDYPVRTKESKFHTYSFDGYTVKLQYYAELKSDF